MGWFGIPLGVATSMFAGMTLGIGYAVGIDGISLLLVGLVVGAIAALIVLLRLTVLAPEPIPVEVAVVERGTNHYWVNRNPEPALLLGVLLDAQ